MTQPKDAPTALSVRLPQDLANELHRISYETGVRKNQLIVEALRAMAALRKEAHSE